jgi:hypothetical protein
MRNKYQKNMTSEDRQELLACLNQANSYFKEKFKEEMQPFHKRYWHVCSRIFPDRLWDNYNLPQKTKVVISQKHSKINSA